MYVFHVAFQLFRKLIAPIAGAAESDFKCKRIELQLSDGIQYVVCYVGLCMNGVGGCRMKSLFGKNNQLAPMIGKVRMNEGGHPETSDFVAHNR